jgi:hypothetical protein
MRLHAALPPLNRLFAGFERVEARATGRSGYAPGDLLKLYIYGYFNHVRAR